MLLASTLFALMGAFAKLSSETLEPVEVVFFRNVFGVVIIGYMIWRRPMQHAGGKPLLLAFRGLIGFLALLAFFYNLAHIPMGDAMTFSKTAPIFTAILAALLLGERLALSAWLAILVGFVGIVLIAKPEGMVMSRYAWLGIFSGLGAALAYTSVRELKRYYDTRAIVLAFTLVGTIGPLLLMVLASRMSPGALDFMGGTFVMPHGIVWLYLIAMGLFATLAQVYMTKAYGLSRAGIVGAASYSNIIFGIALGVTLGDPLPDMLTTFGIILVVFSGVAVAQKK